MTLQENPTYTIFFFGEIRNPLEIRFLLKTVDVQSQKMMQLTLNVLMLSNTEIRPCKLIYSSYKQQQQQRKVVWL